MDKTCSICGVIKPLDMFSVESRNKDGRGCQCKACRRKAQSKTRPLHRDAHNEYKREYRKAHSSALYSREYVRSNPERAVAHNKVKYAVRLGTLTALPCEICGTTTLVHAHHEDYSKPLDVIWLCPLHHKWIHG